MGSGNLVWKPGLISGLGANLTHLLPYDYPDITLSGVEGVAMIGLVTPAGCWDEELGVWELNTAGSPV
jgi:hypothetical protein